MSAANYRCPLCQNPLIQIANSLKCENNHCFDKAKEGYVNLLPVQQKHSKMPGDNKAMVVARREFLDNGFYQPLLDALINLYKEYGNQYTPLLDAGCGEGFYTNQYKNEKNSVYGVDIAKEAIKLAAKKYKTCHFSVATLSHLPFNDDYFSWINSIYAPILETEFSRVLAKDGYLVTVTPAKNHLIELKSLIYRDAKQHDIEKEMIKNLTLVSQKELNYTMNFTDSQDIINLLSMTPFAFKVTDELLEKIKQTHTFECQADFLIKLYKKL